MKCYSSGTATSAELLACMQDLNAQIRVACLNQLSALCAVPVTLGFEDEAYYCDNGQTGTNRSARVRLLNGSLLVFDGDTDDMLQDIDNFAGLNSLFGWGFRWASDDEEDDLWNSLSERHTRQVSVFNDVLMDLIYTARLGSEDANVKLLPKQTATIEIASFFVPNQFHRLLVGIMNPNCKAEDLQKLMDDAKELVHQF